MYAVFDKYPHRTQREVLWAICARGGRTSVRALAQQSVRWDPYYAYASAERRAELLLAEEHMIRLRLHRMRRYGWVRREVVPPSGERRGHPGTRWSLTQAGRDHLHLELIELGIEDKPRDWRRVAA